MKKFAKMSLAAAVAVVGLGSTASAADLAEAIKGVDVSGSLRYRYDERTNDVATSDVESLNSYDLEVTVKSPVNDMVTAVVQFDVDGETDSRGGSDGMVAVNLEQAYFSANTGYATINAGKQVIPGPLTDAATGSGIVALVPAGPVTLAAGYFNNHSVTSVGSRNAIEAAILGSVGPVSFEAWYADVDGHADYINVKADASIEMIKFGAEYTVADIDGAAATADKPSILKTYVSASFGPLSATLRYGATGDDTGTATIDGGAEAPANFLVWNTSLTGKADADVIGLDASYAVTDKISVRAAYFDGDYKNGATKTDMTEVLGQVSYKMSSNLNTYVRMATYEEETSAGKTQDRTRGRLEIKYSF